MASGGEQGQALSVVVPAFNEERRLPALLAALEGAPAAAADAGFELREVIVVDDGSVDGTAGLLQAHQRLVASIEFPRNRGKGAAVKAGLLAASGDVALVTDVDLSTPLGDLSALARALAGGADLVLGSRALPESNVVVHQRGGREGLGKAFNIALRLLTGLPFRDTQCGFKLIRLDAARPLVAALRVDGFAFDAELCVRALQAGLRVEEVPVTWANDPDTRVGPGSAFRMGIDLLRIAWWSRRGRTASE